MKDIPTLLTGQDAMMLKMTTKMWMPFVVMGLGAIVIAFFIGLFNSGNVSEYLSFSKEVRETAVAGSEIVGLRVGIESIKTWLPSFKFLGMGMLFSGITFALAMIILTLKNAGLAIQQRMGMDPVAPPKPMYAKMFPMFMMVGLMILAAVFIIALWLNGIVVDYWDHSIAAELNPAGSGSVILGQLATIASVKAWLVPLKFTGVAFLLTGISLALFTIRHTLRIQAGMMLSMIEGGGKMKH